MIEQVVVSLAHAVLRLEFALSPGGEIRAVFKTLACGMVAVGGAGVVLCLLTWLLDAVIDLAWQALLVAAVLYMIWWRARRR